MSDNTQLNMLREYLDKYKLFDSSLPPILSKLMDSITGNIPHKMKMSIAVSECVVFASQMRRNILLPDKTRVPTNAITFVLSGSGTSKDRASNAVRKCFKDGYDLINHYREEHAYEKSIQMAQASGASDPQAVHEKFYQKPKPLFASIGTSEGMISYMNKLEQDKWGAAYIYSGELGSELQTSPTIVDNIRLLSEMYDLGKKEVKIIKSEEHQSEEINNLPFSALFIGSQENILYDEVVKNKFKLEFTTKLARRSFFNFNKYEPERFKFASVEDRIEFKKQEETKAIKVKNELNNISIDIVQNVHSGDLIIDEDTYRLFLAYMDYNDELSASISNIYPISKLVRKHAQWRALKLAGAFSVLDCKDIIDDESFKQAVSYIETLDEDMRDFEDELSKEKYEVFADYMKYISKDGKSKVSLHDLKKMSFIPTTSSSTKKMDELVLMANSFVDDGLFIRANESSIEYEHREKSYKVGASFKLISGASKSERASKSADGFKYSETEFDKLSMLLKHDYSFLPFELKNGIRKNDNIYGETKWLCLDVDDSGITDYEAVDMLGDYKFHIARTSNPDNPFKFRILLELDAVVDIKDKHWKYFVESVSDEIGIGVDLLPKAQVYFGYEGREVISNLEGETINSKTHLITAMDRKPPEKPKTKGQITAELSNKGETYRYAFEADNGHRSISLIRAAKHAYDLGADNEYIKNLIEEINDYWIEPLDDEEIERTIFSQVDRWEYR